LFTFPAFLFIIAFLQSTDKTKEYIIMNYDIFRAYDIRGVYPQDVNEESYYRIARCYALIFKPKNLVVGMDARVSSPALKKKMVEGLMDSGVNVIDIGEITTDMLYFAVGAYDYCGGIVVSASHNPGQYNGMKMVREKATAISSDTGLFDIRDALKAGKDKEMPQADKGSYTTRDIMDDYIEHVLGFVDRETIKPFTVVANANFGYVSRPVKKIAEKLNLTLVPLNFEPDGSFPKGPPDPMLKDNRTETEALVRKTGADLAVAWDADADRVMFHDETGRFISGAYMTAMLAEILLKQHGHENKIIFDPRVIWPAQKTIAHMNGQGIVSKSGHTFMKDRMRSDNALFAGEMSAHYYFRDNFYADNGIIPFLLVLQHLSQSKQLMSQLIAPFMEGHFMTGELNYKVKDIKAVMTEVQKKYSHMGEESFIDGYSLETPSWRFNIRSSNTEPLLRLNVEAREEELLEKIKSEIEVLINA